MLDGDRGHDRCVAATDDGLVEVDSARAATWAESMDQTIRLATVDLADASTPRSATAPRPRPRASCVGAVGVAALAGRARRSAAWT